MFSIMLLTTNDREQQILKMAFEQMKVKLLLSKPSFSNYVKATQYVPDIILMEMPKIHSEQIQFIKLIKKSKRTKSAALLAYGNPVDKAVRLGIVQSGADCYLERPLKFSELMKIIMLRLKQLSKNVDGLEKEKATDKDADIQAILDKATLPVKKLELMERHVSKMLAFPFAVTKVLHLAESEKSGASDLSNAIETDPVISANILKVANAVFFASANRRIGSIKDAIVRIGFRETKRIVMGMSVMSLFDQNQGSMGFSRTEFWEHSIATATIAEKLAKRMGDINQEETFLAGLLHDFGIILLDEFFQTLFARTLELTTEHGGHFLDSEYSLIGVSHIDLTTRLFESWKIPQAIIEATGGYNNMYGDETSVDTPGKKMALCVAAANIMAKALSLGAACDQYVYPLGNWVFSKAKLATGPNQAFIDEVCREVDGYKRFFGLGNKGKGSSQKDPDSGLEAMKIGIINAANSVFIPPESHLAADGHTCVRIPASEPPKNLDLRYDAVVLWAAKDTLPGSASSLRNILQLPRTEQAKANPPAVPVLACVVPGSLLAAPEAAAEVSAIYQECDLRQFDACLESACSGKHVPLPPLSGSEPSPVPETGMSAGPGPQPDTITP